MGVREANVEKYLRSEVQELGGDTRKWVCPGRTGVTDQIVGVPGIIPIFVEVKTTDGKLSPVQEREHKRLLETMGLDVKTVYGHAGVDMLIEAIRVRLSNAAP